MAGSPKPLSTVSSIDRIQKRIAALERAVGHPAVDPQARIDAASALAAVSVRNRVFRQDTEPTGEFVSGDLWYDTNDGNAPYVWQLVSGRVTTGTTGGQGIQTTAGVGQLEPVNLDASTTYHVTVKLRWLSGGAVELRVRDTANNIDAVGNDTVVSPDGWRSVEAQITTGVAEPALMIALRTELITNQASEFLVDAVTLATTPAGTNLLTNGSFEQGLDTWLTTGALLTTGASLAFERTDAFAGSWVSARDAAVLDASGNRIFRQNDQPTVGQGPFSEGDLWFDSNDKNRPYVYEGGVWVTVRDQQAIDDAAAAASTAASASSAASSAASTANTAYTTASGKNRVFRQSTTPVAGSIPFVNGDLWFRTDQGNKPYSYQDGSWVDAQDTAIATASTAAGNALSVANGKNKVFVQSTTPTATATGDNWIDTSTSANIVKGWNGTTWVAVGVDATKVSGTLNNTVTIPGVTYVDDVVVSRLAAGSVVTASIKALAVTAETIASNQIIARHILAGEITAAAIATDALTAKNYYSAGAGTNRIIVGPAAYYSEPRIVFDVDGTGASVNDPSIRGTTSGLVIHGGTNGSYNTSISMSASVGQPDRILLSAANATRTVTGTLDASFDRFQVNCNLTVDKALGVSGKISSVGTYQAAAASSGFALRITDSGGNYELRPQAASSRRYKHDIDHIYDAPDAFDPRKILGLPVRVFRFNDEYLDPNDQLAGQLVPGFIAEEMHDIYSPAVTLNADGNPENWNERHLIPPMLALIQELNNRVEALENRD